MFVVTIDVEKCKGCAECVEICAVQALSIEEQDGKMVAVFTDNPEECLGCESCLEVCEEGAITIEEW